MNEPLLVKDVTGLAHFEPAVKLQAISADSENRYFRDYILTQDLANVYERMLASVLGDAWGDTASALPVERRRSHLISAQYGAGKSYALMMLSALLSSAGDSTRLQTAKAKFERFSDMRRLLARLSDKKFLIIQVSAEDKGDIRLRELLVRSLLEQVEEVLPDTAFTNEYTGAIDHLEELESLPIGSDFAQVLEDHFDVSLRQLRASLGSYDRESLRIYYQACERALGRAVSRDVLDVEATYREALGLLGNRGYTHIAIIIDELTAYLHASSRHHSLAGTLGELQSFAAYCNTRSSRCLFVGAMHVSVQEFLQDRAQTREYERTRGRFDEHPFPVYSSKLLAGVFRPRLDAFEQATRSCQARVEELRNLIEAFQMTDDGLPLHPSAVFPLHPAVAFYLPRISRELGQAERTSFGFIDEVVRRRLDKPLVVDERLNLVTLDEVFDYFLSAMEQREYYLQIIAAHNVVKSRVGSPLAVRAFKPLALLWVASRVRLAADDTHGLDIDLSTKQVADYLNVQDEAAVLDALQRLRSTGYIYFDASRNRYFYSHSDPGWDLEEEIQEEMGRVDPAEVLRSELEALGLRVCLNAPEKIWVKVERSVESRRLDIKQLKQTSTLKPRHAEASAAFVAPDFVEVDSYESLLRDVESKARELSASNVVVAVPKKVDMLNPLDLSRYRALQEIGKQLDLAGRGSVNEHRVRLVKARFSEVRARVQNDIEAFGQASNFAFFWNRQPREAHDLNTVLAEMFQRHYHQFPNVRVERINGRGTTNALITNCIVNQKTTFPSDSSEVARQARDTLQVLGLCKWTRIARGYSVELREPAAGSEGSGIWQIVLESLTDASDSPLTTLYSRLGEAPYGLPDYMVEVYVAAAIALRKVHIIDKNAEMPPISKSLVRNITKRKDSDFKVLPVQETGVPFTYICSVWRAIDEPLGLTHYQELENSLGRSIDELRMWLAMKADCRNYHMNRLGQVGETLADIGADSDAYRVLSKHLSNMVQILPSGEGFGQVVLLGEKLSDAKVSEDPDAAARAVRQTIQAAEQFLAEFQTLELACRMYDILKRAISLDTFRGSAQKAEQAWQSFQVDALSAMKRQAFAERFAVLWEHYVERYVDEHNAVASARRDYGKQVEASLPHEMIAGFSQLHFRGLVTAASFDSKISATRRKACQPLTEDQTRTFRESGRSRCRTCGYQLGSSVNILKQLQEDEERLATSVNNALDGYLRKLTESFESESVQVYLAEEASGEEKTTIASIQALVSKKQTQMAPAHMRKLKTLLPLVGPILGNATTYVRGQAKLRRELEKKLEEEERRRRIPRLPTEQLGDAARDFLLESGMEEMTLAELRQSMRQWLQGIVDEFGSRTRSGG